MRDLSATLLIATVWAYWFGAGVMIVRVRRESRTLAGLASELRVKQHLWLRALVATRRARDASSLRGCTLT